MDTTPHPSAKPLSADPSALLAQGDERWAQRSPNWRERELAMPWPQDLLEQFTQRMSGHGLCVSRALMVCDRRYALHQLVHAHSLADDTLRLVAVQLFRRYEARQSGIPLLH
ncbi:hypothetical protein [Hydrogenophaga sp.]|uniref:hypothetical protein n=1 Tax=Hydrogenophaga sp. TaxID=1904254 RepID=UPI003F6CA610